MQNTSVEHIIQKHENEKAETTSEGPLSARKHQIEKREKETPNIVDQNDIHLSADATANTGVIASDEHLHPHSNRRGGVGRPKC